MRHDLATMLSRAAGRGAPQQQEQQGFNPLHLGSVPYPGDSEDSPIQQGDLYQLLDNLVRSGIDPNDAMAVVMKLSGAEQQQSSALAQPYTQAPYAGVVDIPTMSYDDLLKR